MGVIFQWAVSLDEVAMERQIYIYIYIPMGKLKWDTYNG